MVNFYIRQIKNGIMSIEQVPKFWKQKVLEELKNEFK